MNIKMNPMTNASKIPEILASPIKAFAGSVIIIPTGIR
jgi:hypothetical protein